MKLTKLSSVTVALCLVVASLWTATSVRADGPATLTLSPETLTVQRKTVFPLTVSLDTGGRPVNVVQFYIELPNRRLDCSDIELVAEGWSGFGKECDTRTAAFVMYTLEPFTGELDLATIELKSRRVDGIARVEFDRERTLVIDEETGTDILGTTNKSLVNVER